MNKYKETIYQALRLIFGALVLAALLAYADYRWMEPNRTPPCDPSKLSEGHICLTTVLKQWGYSKIVWVDARNQDAFERGTVKNGQVLSIRNDEKAADLLAKALPVLHQAGIDDKCIVVFCDRSCNAASEIAEMLKGFQLQAPIYILEGGWDEIRKNPSLAS